MAARTFLNQNEIAEFIGMRPKHSPNGEVDARLWDISPGRWVADRALEKFAKLEAWAPSRPIIVGSWARGEVTPRSDLDLVCTGDTKSIEALVGEMKKTGAKVRARHADADWFSGVDIFDQVSLLHGKPGNLESTSEFEEQKQKFLKANPNFREKVLERISKERQERILRHDTIANYLEPNLKFGRGGLRDIYQSQLIGGFFSDRFGNSEHAFGIFKHYLEFWLGLRSWLHLQDAGSDILHAASQFEAAQWFGFADSKQFMREVQKGLSRVSFYWDWAIAMASASPRKRKDVQNVRLRTPEDISRVLCNNPNILLQQRIRTEQSVIWKANQPTKASLRKRGRELASLLDVKTGEESMVAAFESRWIDFVLPDFLRITGYVQHDQYHRFTVDAHLLNIIIALKRVYNRPKLLFALKPLIMQLKSKDWQILAWAGLFHDLAKGRSGDHSIEGSELAKRELSKFGIHPSLISEIQWLVENHLVMSQAAFRMNPSSSLTWKFLEDHEVQGIRSTRLAVFTAVDIIATNPDAWNAWKSELLYRVHDTFRRKQTSQLLEFARKLQKIPLPQDPHAWIEQFDPYFLEHVASHRKMAKSVVADIKECSKSKNRSVHVVRMGPSRPTWIRYQAKDEPGLFLKFVLALSQAGCSIRHASVMTDPQLGVYDWFEVSEGATRRISAPQLEKLLIPHEPKTDFVHIEFDDIQVISPTPDEWIVRFRGRDQRGALLSAAAALYRSGAEIRWAKVNTWGRQIDDVFGIKPPTDTDDPKVLSRQLREKPKIG